MAEFVNVAFFSTRIFLLQEHATPPTPYHAIFAFLVLVLLDFLKLRYLGMNSSPFQTHPKSMSAAIASLLAYCLAYDAEPSFSSIHPAFAYARVIRRAKVIFGLLCSVSLSSILFPDSIQVVLYSLFVLFLASELAHHQLQMTWNWFYQRIRGAFNNWRWFIVPHSTSRRSLLPL